MIQGAGSNVGKSMLVAGICRALVLRGYSVAPFKPQNMSNNAAVTIDGGEIGRAQALQAAACQKAPIVDMNPVLLKPESEIGAQVILQGKKLTTVKAREYAKLKTQLMPKVLESYFRLAKTVDFIIVEGAGSPAEINLRAGDIANMGFAQAAQTPVIIIGDIDRGGVIAQLVGTNAILSHEDRARITGFVINKFRGDTSLFDEGMTAITKATQWKSIGILPWFENAWKLPAEDVMDIANRPGGILKIAVLRLDRISNFDDLDPLVAEPNITVEIIEPGRPIPGDAELVILPGSKSTISDLENLRVNGWDIDLKAHHRRGGKILGICGGYQMLGTDIHDPEGIEGLPSSVAGLGYLDVTTIMASKKNLSLVSARTLKNGIQVNGYEIHIGVTSGPDCDQGWLEIDGRKEGAISKNGQVLGCYLHGLFASDGFRTEYLKSLGIPSGLENYDASIDETLDELAGFIENNLDFNQLIQLAKIVPKS
jgi:adenosylcobyric acid synthase